MTDFKALIRLLQSTVADFSTVLPGIQRQMLDRLRVELNFLQIGKDGTIAMKAANVAAIAKIRAKLMEIMVTPAYKDAVKAFAGTFAEIERLQNSYFNQLDAKYSPPGVAKALRNQAVETSVLDLTERGLDANVVSGVEDLLRKSITGGGSYADLQQHLENYLTENATGEGQLQKYAKQITTDSLNQYSAQYSQLVASDLGLEWFIYAGSNIETSRPFCLACTKKRYIHISEFPALLAGDFPEFREFDGKMYKGLPAGMIPDTTPANLPINRGGYNCGHQLRPVSERAVPQSVRDALAKSNGAGAKNPAPIKASTPPLPPLPPPPQFRFLSDDEYNALPPTPISPAEYTILRDPHDGYIQTANSFEINNHLRGIPTRWKNIGPQDLATIATIKAAIKRSQAPANVKGFRKVRLEDLDKILGLNFNQATTLAEVKAILDANIGHTFLEKAFTSLSLNANKNVFTTRQVVLEIDIPAQTHWLVTDNKHESEVILDTNQTFEIKSAEVLPGSELKIVVALRKKS